MSSSRQPEPAGARPSREEAEDAVRTLIRWAGDDPAREGLLDTPSRVTRAYGDWFSGYEQDPASFLGRTFSVPIRKKPLFRSRSHPIRNHNQTGKPMNQ